MSHILFTSADPNRDLYGDEEYKAIDSTWRGSSNRDELKLASAFALSPAELMRNLNYYKPIIFHFTGHGTEKGNLVFQPDDSKKMRENVEPGLLEEILIAAGKSIKVAVLNACSSDAHAKVITSVVDCAIGVRGTIKNGAGMAFVKAFYDAIGSGESVDTAFNQGVLAVRTTGLNGDFVLETKTGIDAKAIFLTGIPPVTPKHTILEMEELLPQATLGVSIAGKLTNPDGYAFRLYLKNTGTAIAKLFGVDLKSLSENFSVNDLKKEHEHFSRKTHGAFSVDGVRVFKFRSSVDEFLSPGDQFEFAYCEMLKTKAKEIILEYKAFADNVLELSQLTIDYSMLEAKWNEMSAGNE